MPVLRIVDLDRTKPESCWLLKHAKKEYSQNGEDGILEKLWEVIGAENKWCVEFGAWDGVHLSNTCHFIRQHGWSGVLIEGNEAKFAEIKQNFPGRDDVHPVCTTIGFIPGKNTIDDALAPLPIPKDFDFISIDIDGNDYHIWKSIETYRPRVVCIEFNPAVPNDVVFIQDRNMKIHQGASLAALIELGKEKGYELAAVTNCNGIFVLAELFPKLGIADNSIDAMRKNVTGRIFGTYDGTIYNHTRPLNWAGQGQRPARDQFQLLKPSERVFYDQLPDGGTVTGAGTAKPSQAIAKNLVIQSKKLIKRAISKVRK